MCRRISRTQLNPFFAQLRPYLVADLADRLHALHKRIATYHRRVAPVVRQTETAQRLLRVAGMGLVTARSCLQRSGMPTPSRTEPRLTRDKSDATLWPAQEHVAHGA